MTNGSGSASRDGVLPYARRLEAFRPSPILQLLAKVDELRAEGVDVISLGAGESELNTPNEISAQGKKAIDDGQTRYTPSAGLRDLRMAIAEDFRQRAALDCNERNVVVTSGAKQAIFSAMMATVEEGDEVVIPLPAWGSYAAIASLCGGRSVSVLAGPESGYKVTATMLEEVLSPSTRWLVLVSPGNPTGAVYERGEFDAIADVVRRYPNLRVMVDSIYDRLIYDDVDAPTLPAVAPDLASRVLIVDGVSKAYRMTGWRIGYAIGPEGLISRMVGIQSQSTSCPCSISQMAALEALRGPQTSVEDMRNLYRQRRDLTVELLSSVPGIKPFKPAGAMYIFCDCAGLLKAQREAGSLINDDLSLADFLLTYHGVAVVPGRAFGAPDHIRISFAVSEPLLKEACQRIGAGVAALAH